MSSIIVSNDLHLMMLEIAVGNLFVPWATDFDKVILKKTSILFRMLDDEWTSLSPNRRDYRSYRGSNCEDEKFYGGRSVVFCVSASFLEEKASGVDVELCVLKEVCKYFEMDQCQKVGIANVPVDDLLNSIRKQIHERDELAEHLSDFYKRQIISRSMIGIHALQDENFKDTAATISLYIRISYLGRSVITEIAPIENTLGSFCAHGKPDEEQPYHLQQLTVKQLQSGHWDGGLPRIPRARLICRCEELVGKETAYPAATRGLGLADDAVDAIDVTTIADDTIETRETAESAADVVDTTRITAEAAVTDADAITAGIAVADVKGSPDAAAVAEAKGKAIKDKKALRKAAPSKSKRGATATIGIAEGRKRTCAPSPPSFSCLQTYPLCRRLQPHPTCFNYCLDISPCYCSRTACSLHSMFSIQYPFCV